MSLIEIMIAVAILAITVSLAIPAYRGYVNEASIATAIQEIRQMELVLNDLYQDGDPPASLAAVGLDLVDPWGNPYRYLQLRDNSTPGINGRRRRDKNNNPVNSDYDLYSLGADGRTAAQFMANRARDDVVRANDGAYVGLARDH